jgi:cellulose biosynthesis protein BcsQ
MKQITVYVCNNDKKGIIDPLMIQAKSFPNIQIIGAGPQNEASLKEIAISKPMVAVTGQLDSNEAITLCKVCQGVKIVMLCFDENRGASTINDLEKAGFPGNTFLMLANISPKQVFETISDSMSDELAEPEAAPKDPMADFVDGKPGTVVSAESVAKDPNATKPVPDQAVVDEEKDILDEADKLDDDKSKKTDILSMKSKVISVYSRKGGVGKTTIAKELANLFSSIVMPSRVNPEGENLKVCLVDLDFEQGNIRSELGIENPMPNIYVWLDDIAEKVKNGMSIDQIDYSKMQVMSRFVKKLTREFYVVSTDQGPIPQRLMDSIADSDKDGTLYKKMISIILTDIIRSFDIVVIDNSSSFDEADLVSMEKADVIVYPVCPSIADAENLKVFASEMSDYDTVDLGKVALVENKLPKKGTIRDMLDSMISVVRYKEFSYGLNRTIEKNFRVVAQLDYDEDVIGAEDSMGFVTDGGMSQFKKGIVKLAEFILPIFKARTSKYVKENVDPKKEAKKKAWIEKQKAKEDKKKGIKPAPQKDAAKDIPPADGLPVAKDGAAPTMGSQPNAGAAATPAAKKPKKIGFFAKLFAKKPKQTYEQALAIISAIPGIKKNTAGLPILPPTAKIPKEVSGRNARRYQKECNAFFNELRKRKKGQGKEQPLPAKPVQGAEAGKTADVEQAHGQTSDSTPNPAPEATPAADDGEGGAGQPGDGGAK